ncbi:hypothetical protein [Streptomyces sp. NPDC056549]|uniref:hypothetical protein n=1 Tax=Streptomyces sp. NPDC056549 TaxID=3345864 RepID=UPI0036CE8307
MITLTPGDVGADRPLGTWMRAHPQATLYFNVLYPDADRYKTDDVANEQRISLDHVDRVTVATVQDGFRISAWHPGGGVAHTFVVDTVLSTWAPNPPLCLDSSRGRMGTVHRTSNIHASWWPET